ncbi:MAG TPA: CvpA family protein [Rhodocyclaceae bacterium]|nr:CvpA family protein [Rhodocyclaceae bacterium]
MTAFDYCFLGLVALSVVVGCWRGLISELFALAGWIVAFIAAKKFAPNVLPLAASWVNAPWLRYAVAFAAIFVLVLLLMAGIRFLIRELLSVAGLSLFDRLLGALFGVVRAVLVAFVAVAVAGLTQLPRKPWWHDAVFAPPLETVVIAVKPWLPKDLAARIKYR